MKKLFFIAALLSTNHLWANMDFYLSGATKLELKQDSGDQFCPYQTNKKEIIEIIEENIEHLYPQLQQTYQDNRIQLREFNDDAYFLKTFFKLAHILKEKRLYYIDINTKVYPCAPTKLALKAILAHELKHIVDYQNSNSLQLIRLGIKMIGKKSRSHYERATDFYVMEKGLAQGIKEYRQWIYQRLNEKSLHTKQCYYYTPEEIDRFLKGETEFSDYFAKYCK